LLATFWGAEASAQLAPEANEAIAIGDYQLKPLVEVRARGEYRRDALDLGESTAPSSLGVPGPRVRDALVFFSRARLGVEASRDLVLAKVTLQDVRAFGATPPSGIVATNEPFATTGAYEAFLEVHARTTRPSFLRIGRQAVTWGEGLLLGGADWAPAARALDGLRGRYVRGAWEVEGLAALLDVTRPLGPAFGDTAGPTRFGTALFGARSLVAIDPLLHIELAAIARVADRATPPPTLRFDAARSDGETYTASLRVHGDHRGFSYAVEGAGQVGRAPTLDVARRAFALFGRVGKTFEEQRFAPGFQVGGAYASGDDGDGTYTQFDPILPDVHAFRGFRGALDAFAFSNIVEGNLGVHAAPSGETKVALHYHYARLANSRGEWRNAYLLPVSGIVPSGEAELGHEIDALFAWTPWAPLDLRAGYSVLVLGDGARTRMAAQGRGEPMPNGTFAPAALAHFAYVQATMRIP
jgi:hypothetical protein